MRLRNKLGVFLPVTGLLLLCLGFSGAWYVLQLQRQNSQILDVNVASIRAAEEMELLVREMRHELGVFLLTLDREHLVTAASKQQEANNWLATASALSGSDEEIACLTEVSEGLEEYFAQLHRLVDDPMTEISFASVRRLQDEMLSKQVLQAAHRYLDLNENELEQSNQQNQAMAQKLALVMALLGACGGVVGLEAGYGVARAINRSMFLLTVPIRDVAGKLDTVVGPIEISADPTLQDLQLVLENVSNRVGSVVEQLQLRHHEVIRADQLVAVGQLAAGLAHEIRNPLMCMKTLVQSARRKNDQANLNATDLAVLDEEITRVDRLLQTFLDFARPAPLQFQPVELAPIVHKTLDLVASRAQTRQIEIECRMPDQPLTVQGDATQLRQVLLNLLLNALDAVANHGQIMVELQRQTQEPQRDEAPSGGTQNWICLSVADNGCGLPDMQRERIFEPFFSTKDPGVGLGLAVSKRIIEAHQGELTAEDRDQGGTVFKVMLPLSGVLAQT
ncbi:sensor histidine kinase [Novipirellula caenicola]|uniref:histidine kinase n=1 Tax=Novipirellula caenicola TaxID=1536901 RepID=A0ABP9VYT6_9BACT